jgi:ABC-type transporter Mla subunit MlaD
MTEEERKKRIQAILDKHDEAFAAMREAREQSRATVRHVQRVDTSVGRSIEGLRTVLDGLASANDANQSAHEGALAVNDAVLRAIDIAREANHMAIALLNEL